MPDPSAQNDAAASGGIRRIAGFEILSRVGQGGMGSVFKARQSSLDRIVALKVLPPSLAKSTSFIERFQREARASARLNHENIVQGIDVGKDDATGLWYFAMEYVDGPSLREILKKQGKLPEEEALRITRAIAAALECAHKAGIVHRDIKPDNILIASGGTPKLADLGLAKKTQDDASLTMAGTTVGTPHYMAPEQVRGLVDRVDVRSDLYSLGGTLFHLVTGQTPFAGETPAVIMSKQLNDTPPRANKVNPQVSEPCARLIAKLMQKAPEKRVQTPSELIQQIDAVLSGEAASATTGRRPPIRGATTGPVAPTSERRAAVKPQVNRASLLLAVTGVAVLLLVGGVFLLSGKDDAPKPPKKEPVVEHKIVEPVAPPRVTEVQPKPAEPNPKDLKAIELFDAAQQFAQQNADDLDGIIRQYTQAVEAAQGTSLAPKAEAALKDARQKRESAALAAFQQIKEESEKLADSGDFDAALAKLDAAGKDEKLATFVNEAIAASRKALVERAEKAVKEALQKAEAPKLRYAPLQAEINARIEALASAAKNADSAKLYKAFSDEFAKLLAAGKSADIAKLGERFAGKLAPEDDAKLKADLAFAANAEAFLKWLRPALAKLPAGAFQMDLKLGAAVFQKYNVQGDRLELQVKTGGQTDLELTKMERPQLVRAARICAGGSDSALPPERARDAACFLMAGGKPDGVKALLDAAKGGGVDVETLYTRLAIIERGAKEVEAEALLAQFDKFFKARDWKGADPLGQRLLKEFADTQAVKARPDFPDLADQAHHNGLPLKVYVLTLQEGQPIPEAGLEEYKGTATASPYAWKGAQDHFSDGRGKMRFGENKMWWPMIRFKLLKREGGFLPDDAEVQDAKLSVCKLSGYGPFFELRQLTTAWSDEEVTWNSATKTTKWTTPGGDVTEKMLGTFQMKWEARTWAEFNVTESLREMLKDDKNFGWRLDTYANKEHVLHMNLGELIGRSFGEASLRPKLVLKVQCRLLKEETESKSK